MEVDADIEQLKSDLALQMKRTRANRTVDKRKSAFVAVYVGIVSAVTTVCIGIVSFIPTEYANLFGLASLLTSASLTVVIAWDGIFHHKKLWINAAMAFNELCDLDTDIRHAQAKSSNINQTQANAFYERYKEILRAHNERWYKIRE